MSRRAILFVLMTTWAAACFTYGIRIVGVIAVAAAAMWLVLLIKEQA